VKRCSARSSPPASSTAPSRCVLEAATTRSRPSAARARTLTAAAPTRSSSSTTSPPTSRAATSRSTRSPSTRSTATSSTRSAARPTSTRGVLRAVGDARRALRRGRPARPARRALRATLECTIDEDTERRDGLTSASLDTFRKVSAERVRDEWMKTMSAEPPERRLRGDAPHRPARHHLPRAPRVRRLRAEQVARVRRVGARHGLPRRLPSPTRPPRRARCSTTSAKPRTRAFSDKTNDYTFYEHERVGAEMAEPILAAPPLLQRRAREDRRARPPPPHLLLGRLDRRRRAPLAPPRHPRARARLLYELGFADARGKGRTRAPTSSTSSELERRARPSCLASGAALSARDLQLNGRDLMKELVDRPGPRHRRRSSSASSSS
jgi:tRNA nucleotidyltransferase (CCA-adding enzyme)